MKSDIIIRNALLIDGTDATPFEADVAISNGRIETVGTTGDASARQEIDAAGKVAAPGFIDIHTHADAGLLSHPEASNYLSQGVTSVIGGNCGGGPLPVSGFVERVDASDVGINIGVFVGHNSVRRQAMGSEDRAPSQDELGTMREFVDAAMQDGAFGLSSGLKYIPGAYAHTDEVVELAKAAATHGGVYMTHMRDEGLELMESIEEAISISREGGLPLQISHFKAIGKSMWGRAGDMLSKVDNARGSGQDVTFDQYPYTASSTGLNVLFPSWALEGGRKACLDRWQDPKIRPKIRKHIEFSLMEDRGGGDPANVVVVTSHYDPALNGLDLGSISSKLLGDSTIETVTEVVVRLAEAGHHPCIFHCLHEDDVRQLMQHPAGLVASDSHILSPDETHPHPRNMGTFPRVLGHYVRNCGVLSLSEAIRKMTGAVASRLGLEDRGLVREGHWADLVVLDPDTVADRATWDDPLQPAAGIHHVLVNGRLALSNDEPTGTLAGRFLRRPTSTG
ncbi:MAG: D-aminoacylase [Candidatus Latescibacteria bacterium]|nr:D-aminoacylase [Candidatus Latescibacterota bacterium]